MKNVLILFILMISFSLQAKTIETSESIILELETSIDKNEDAKTLYSQLNLPVDFGTLITGKPHSYKAHQDKDKNYLIYCSEKTKNNFHCIFKINKKLNGDLHTLEMDDVQVHLQINDYDEAYFLYKMLNVPALKHGTWLQKVIFDNENWFGLSCITDSNSYADYQCDYRVFKKN